MPTTLEAVFACIGAFFILAGIFDGEFTYKNAKIKSFSKFYKVMLILLGFSFIVISLFTFMVNNEICKTRTVSPEKISKFLAENHIGEESKFPIYDEVLVAKARGDDYYQISICEKESGLVAVPNDFDRCPHVDYIKKPKKILRFKIKDDFTCFN